MLQVQKMEAIGTLAGGIAHDFNNILSAVIGYTELALFDVEEESTLHRSLLEVLKAGRRASDLVKQILTFSRQSKHEAKAVHLNPLVKEALKMLRSTIPTSIEIREDIHSNLLTIRPNRPMSTRSLLTLSQTPRRRCVKRSVILRLVLPRFPKKLKPVKCPSGMVTGEYAKLTVKDNGEGISKKHIDHIFRTLFYDQRETKGNRVGARCRTWDCRNVSMVTLPV